MPIDNHDKDILHSLYGRKFGMDGRGLMTGFPDNRYGTETITSTVASTLAPAGTSLLQATVAGVYELVTPQASMVGARKRLVNNSTEAVAMLVKLTAGNFTSLLGTSHTTLNLSTRGAYADLEYISTARVAVMLQTTSSAISNVVVTTTT